VKAFGYVRLSKMDEGTTSPQRQRRAISKWCRDRGVELVDTFEDLDLSAYSRRVRRPGLERMLARLGEVDTVVTWRLDRLARSVSGFSKLLETFEEARVQMATTDGQVDMTTAAGRAMVQMTAVFAELEAGTTSERARQMHAYKRERGEWVGRVPYGFKLNGQGLEVDPETFPVLEEAARRYVAGESLRRISADLRITHGNLAKRLRADHVLQHLPSEVAGSLITEMNERGRTGSRAKRSLLGGIARCGVCVDGLTVKASRSGWAAYGCKPGHTYISKGWLDEYVAERVLEAVDTGKLLTAIAKRRKRPAALHSSEIEARLEMLERDFYEMGQMPRDRYLVRREGLLKRLQEAREAETDRGIDLPAELARNLSKRWPDLSILGRRRIIAAVVDRIVIDKATSHGKIDPSRVRIEWRR
jgi:DNA invertase Pin-like site-specific DNA recombinase